ncbi:DJ-1/PfpI family protein [Natronospira bacteriovora]|uniref:DJ-1/PfpI family protein n=1 Tax=Natronospira bacteriovora TaxID=3069753 RepID=A0ABU0W796_9GAMM|nr:DJ-1/PfpI family protein [Natronospira sp. AB-CW4]MDQ2069340.1 DJ-1/PfpI family protein [Natronospira sp. AB-CW4]
MSSEPGITEVVRESERRVGILVFDGVEVLDFAGPFEVFSVARRGSDHSPDTVSPCPPVLMAPQAGNVCTTGGMNIRVDHSIDSVCGLHALVIPGGYGVRALMGNPRLLDWLRASAVESLLMMSVCTGAGVLARAGLLRGRRVTTHHRYLDWLSELEPDCEVVADQRFVDAGDLITAGGISAGIDAALHLLERWEGTAVAEETARYMEYRRQPV